MRIGFLKDNESRVSVTPLTLKKYIDANHSVCVEKNAGEVSGFSDKSYNHHKILSRKDVIKSSDVLVLVNSSSIESYNDLKGKTIISNFSVEPDRELIKQNIKKNKITAFDLSMIPRTTIAQSMDILSSMAGLSGYKAVIKAAELLPKIFPMTITAAGSIKPVKVVVLGSGVAGLQAIATAKRLGAIVEASDPRQAAREEVLSLGAKFIDVEGALEDKTAGGYAVKQSKEYLKKQKEEVSKKIIEADVVITTTQVFGSKSPILISKDIVEKMNKGSVIIDLASSTGGNCELTTDSKIIDYNGVKIVGNSYLASELSHDASNLYSNNVYNFINHIICDDKLIDDTDDILKNCKI